MAIPESDPALLSERDPRPVVALPRPGLPGAAIALIAAVLAILLFVVLDGRRRHAQPVTPPSDLPASSAFPAPPALALPPEPAPPPPLPMVMPAPEPRLPRRADIPVAQSPAAPEQIVMPVQPVPGEAATAKLAEPALVLDNGTTDGIGSRTAGAAQGGDAAAAATDDAAVRTTVIRNRTTIMPVGTMIPAVLETPIDSARPGLVRAIVSEDARGFDGRRVLIPKGSRLIGDYQSDVRSGQNRVLVTWTRLIRPDGVAIRIGSPAADAMGGSGIPGHVNSFFFQRFASAVLQSALDVGVNLASRQGNGSVIVAVPGSLGTASQTLLPSSDYKPKIIVKQGASMSIFVAHDLDFSGAPAIGGPTGAPQDGAR